MTEERYPAALYLLHIQAYFKRISDLWEGPDGIRTDGTERCMKLIKTLEELIGEPMALGLDTLPPMDAFWLPQACLDLMITVDTSDGVIITDVNTKSPIAELMASNWVTTKTDNYNSVTVVQLDDNGKLEGYRHIFRLTAHSDNPRALLFNTKPVKRQYLLFKYSGSSAIRLVAPGHGYRADPDEFTATVLPR